MPSKQSAALTFVVGGAASGKSAFAEKRILDSGLRPVYVATAQAWDDEMRAKISQHRERRGNIWTTKEAPFDLSGALRNAAEGDILLIDCLTMWLTNQLLAEHDLPTAVDTLLDALCQRRCAVICVSNEVGQGIVPDNALARRFREAQGALNQRVAAEADDVIAVMAGLPLLLKGKMPS